LLVVLVVVVGAHASHGVVWRGGGLQAEVVALRSLAALLQIVTFARGVWRRGAARAWLEGAGALAGLWWCEGNLSDNIQTLDRWRRCVRP
jgi:hypothetical protein